VDENVELVIRSKDVIHSVFLPHLRAQMNAVPGMSTRIHMMPTITTDSMRMITANDKFDYILMCNKICGASHYNMQMPLIVEPAGAYNVWLSQQKGFESAEPMKADAATVPADTTMAPATTAAVAATNEPKTN
jgi:cytochrome c oxidase subunit II